MIYLKISLEHLGKKADLSCGSLNYKNKVEEVDPNLLIICTLYKWAQITMCT